MIESWVFRSFRIGFDDCFFINELDRLTDPSFPCLETDAVKPILVTLFAVKRGRSTFNDGLLEVRDILLTPHTVFVVRVFVAVLDSLVPSLHIKIDLGRFAHLVTYIFTHGVNPFL